MFAFKVGIGENRELYLSSTLSASILSTLDESGIPIGTNKPVIESCAINVAHGVLGIGSRVVFDEAEAARCLLVAVEAHYDALDVTGATE